MKIAMTPRFYNSEENNFIVVEKKYYHFLNKFGHHLHLIPFLGKDIGEYLDEIEPDAIIFSGGYAYYTKEIGRFEREVMKQSLKRNLPILGICCGMWTINYYFGGSLKHDATHQCMTESGIDMKKWRHPVTVTEFIKTGKYTVNSFHAKVIERVGSDLRVFISGQDGVVEGFYNEEKRIMGVQFHMENKGVSSSLTKRIMKKFESL